MSGRCVVSRIDRTVQCDVYSKKYVFCQSVSQDQTHFYSINIEPVLVYEYCILDDPLTVYRRGR